MSSVIRRVRCLWNSVGTIITNCNITITIAISHYVQSPQRCWNIAAPPQNARVQRSVTSHLLQLQRHRPRRRPIFHLFNIFLLHYTFIHMYDHKPRHPAQLGPSYHSTSFRSVYATSVASSQSAQQTREGNTFCVALVVSPSGPSPRPKLHRDRTAAVIPYPHPPALLDQIH